MQPPRRPCGHRESSSRTRWSGWSGGVERPTDQVAPDLSTPLHSGRARPSCVPWEIRSRHRTPPPPPTATRALPPHLPEDAAPTSFAAGGGTGGTESLLCTGSTKGEVGPGQLTGRWGGGGACLGVPLPQGVPFRGAPCGCPGSRRWGGGGGQATRTTWPTRP